MLQPTLMLRKLLCCRVSCLLSHRIRGLRKLGYHSSPRRLSCRQAEATKGADSSGRTDTNRALAQELQELLKGDHFAFRNLQVQTARFRAGQISAQDLQQRFTQALGHTRKTSHILATVARLLPPGSKRAALLAEVQQGNSASSSSDNWQQLQIPASLRDSLQESLPVADHTDSSKAESMLLAELADADSSSKKQGPRQSPGPSVSRRVKQRRMLDSAPLTVGGKGVLLWLRTDLRLHDHTALDAAARRATRLGGQLAFCYVHSPEEDGDDLETGTSWRPTGASLVWQHGGLKSFDADLQAQHGPGAAIIYRKGPYLQALQGIIAALDIGVLFYSRRYEPAMQATDVAVDSELSNSGIEVHAMNTTLLHEPGDVRIAMGGRWVGHYGTLSPFLRACEKLSKPGKPIPAPTNLPVAKQALKQQAEGLCLEQLGMVKLPRRSNGELVRWDAPILASWDISEAAALRILEDFASNGLSQYEAARHFADARAVSRLSPYVHGGQLSARQVLSVVADHGGKHASKTFWRRLVWRDLAYWQLHHWPEMSCKPIRFHYSAQEWHVDPAALEAWQKGQTGFPMVDAGMRQLWKTGWMQQSVRMICAVFLTEYLSINWIHGCRWFHQCLVDADLAINSMMVTYVDHPHSFAPNLVATSVSDMLCALQWQNAGKSGLDQWNFTLLPSSSSQDPNGMYAAEWVPELKELPKKYIHQPWLAPHEVLTSAGVILGQTYPHRITGSAVLQDLRKGNAHAIRKARKAVERDWVDSAGYDLVVAPKGTTTDMDDQKVRVFTKRDYRYLDGVNIHGD